MVTTLGRIRDLERESLYEAGRSMLLDTVLFLVLGSPVICKLDSTV